MIVLTRTIEGTTSQRGPWPEETAMVIMRCSLVVAIEKQSEEVY